MRYLTRSPVVEHKVQRIQLQIATLDSRRTAGGRMEARGVTRTGADLEIRITEILEQPAGQMDPAVMGVRPFQFNI